MASWLVRFVLVAIAVIVAGSCSEAPESAQPHSPSPAATERPLTLDSPWLLASHHDDVALLRLPARIENELAERFLAGRPANTRGDGSDACWRVDEALLGEGWRASVSRQWRVVGLDGASRFVTTNAVAFCDHEFGVETMHLVSENAPWSADGRLLVEESLDVAIALAETRRAPVVRVPEEVELDEDSKSAVVAALREARLDVSGMDMRARSVYTQRHGTLQETLVVAFSSGGEWETALRVFAIVERGEDGGVRVLRAEGPTCYQCPVSFGGEDFEPVPLAAVDLDGDGNDELLVTARRYESESTRVYRWSDDRYRLHAEEGRVGE